MSESPAASSCLMRASILSAALALSVSPALSQTVIAEYPHPAPLQVTQTQDGFTAQNSREVLQVTVCSDSVMHVVARPAGAPESTSPRPWILDKSQSCPGAASQFSQASGTATLSARGLVVTLSDDRSSLVFKTPQGEMLIHERPNLPRTYFNTNTAGLYQIEDRFGPDATEAFYGLGQHQSGMFNYRGSTVELGQNNTDVAIPLLVSSKGYAILWNTAAFSYADNRFPLELNFESAAAGQIDYYVLYGPQMDQIAHEYRSITGHVPLFPEWAYGFFQSKDRYKTQQEILDVAAGYRQRHIPLDGIVQDWFWWKNGGKGDPVFNSGYTDVPAELTQLHSEHVHAMISAWAMMDATAKNYQLMHDKGWEIPGTQVYDATNPEARNFFWNDFIGKLFAQGWDAFWLDSSEPEEAYPHIGDAVLRYKQLHIGSGLEYTNIFPFEHTLGVSNHWQRTTQQKRVFILTRSAFMGQQRVGATVWSGDVYSTWWALQRQVPAGLNFALSGYPYWTTDIGGYHEPFPGAANQPQYQELYTRWFEYGAFCPVFRTHGHRDHNELWTWDKAYPTLLAVDQLRYRLMPYIYSLAWKVTSDDYTIQRPLVMDFRTDRATWNIGDEFLFGPAILVSPVLTEHATERRLYLPSGAEWYDFWTGRQTSGGKEITAPAPLDRIPLDVRAGSIIPLGPAIEYAGEKTDPIELRIYPGANGEFSLYEDQGDTYAYKQGAHSLIPIRWDDATRMLSIGARQGTYPGMKPDHTFDVVIVGAGHGIGASPTANPDKTIDYNGSATEAKF
ncbi:MAG TPA: TIM-barrel domain-containing protein [Terracidiphilus sp.]|nr:TIM-barrel domain-containing protein [Terracidiphilus sp.]